MGGVYGEINSRADFDVCLQKALREGKAFLVQRPGDPAIEPIVQQLEAVATWSANGGKPTKDQRSSIDIGVRASRELEADPETYSWNQDLYALDSYIEDWPSDEKAANATDDDFWDSDDDDDDDDDP